MTILQQELQPAKIPRSTSLRCRKGLAIRDLEQGKKSSKLFSVEKKIKI
jgi:hypothetical protein